MLQSGTYPVFEHTGMAERETIFHFTVEGGVLSGSVTIDAAPGVIETLPIDEASLDGDSFMALIHYGNTGRRYKGTVTDGKAAGTMTFEGGFDGISIEFDTEKREVTGGPPPGSPPPGGPGGPPPGGPGGPPPAER